MASINFNKQQTYPFVAEIGKMANICGKINISFKPNSLILLTKSADNEMKIELDTNEYDYRCNNIIHIQCDVKVLLNELIENLDLREPISIWIDGDKLYYKGTPKLNYQLPTISKKLSLISTSTSKL